MSKDIYSKREDLICGKIDLAQEKAILIKDIELLELLDLIRYDAQRMEQKLIFYKSNKCNYTDEDLKYAFEQGKKFENPNYKRTFENVIDILKNKKSICNHKGSTLNYMCGICGQEVKSKLNNQELKQIRKIIYPKYNK